MTEYRTMLERDLERVTRPAGFTVDDVRRRRDRKRRNQRITAGVVGMVAFLAAVWIVTNGLPFASSQPPTVPGGAGTVTNTRITAQSAAIDDEFRGWYRVIGRDGCSSSFRDRVQVLYLSETRRYLAHAGFVWSGRLRYMLGRRFPWQTTNNGPFSYELRYRPLTDTAVGIRTGLQGCTWDVRLTPIE